MRKHNLIFSLMLMMCVTAFFSCKEEEVEKPVVNTARVDALRAELRQLELDVLGKQLTLETAELTQEQLETQIENLKETYNKVVTYTIIVVDPQGKLLEGAKVKLNQGGVVTEATTNANGRATFENARGGMIGGVVKMENYTTANYSANIANYEENLDAYGATTRIILFPKGDALTDANSITVTAYAFYNHSILDDTLGGNAPDAGNNPSTWSMRGAGYDYVAWDTLMASDEVDVRATFINNGVPAGSGSGAGVGDVWVIAYEEAWWPATFNDDGSFTLKLPATGIFDDGDDYAYSLELPEFAKIGWFTMYDETPYINAANGPKTWSEEIMFETMWDWIYSDIPGTHLSGNNYRYFYPSPTQQVW